MTSNLGVQNVSFFRKLRRFSDQGDAKRSNRRRRWGSNLAQKGLAAFQPASVTLSLACLRQSAPVDWDK
jgi:hypothetical protein